MTTYRIPPHAPAEPFIHYLSAELCLSAADGGDRTATLLEGVIHALLATAPPDTYDLARTAWRDDLEAQTADDEEDHD